MTENVLRDAAGEHPAVVRVTHWLLALAGLTLVISGLEISGVLAIFRGATPARDLFTRPEDAGIVGLLNLHVICAWIFMGAALVYAVYQLASGNYRQVLFTKRDVGGVWPMARHYFLFGPKPPQRSLYNPLQKLAYTTIIGLGAWLVVTGFVLHKPMLFSPLVTALGGYRIVRIGHFLGMCAALGFIPGHLVMVALQGWQNFLTMWTGGRAGSPKLG